MKDPIPAIKEHPEGSTIEVKVRPSSSRRGVAGLSAGRILVSVHSPPEKGKANKEALQVLSDALGIPPSRLGVIRGQSSRDKTVLARGISPADVLSSLRQL